MKFEEIKKSDNENVITRIYRKSPETAELLQSLMLEIGEKTIKSLDESLDTIMSDKENDLDLHTQIEMLTQIIREQQIKIKLIQQAFEKAGYKITPKQTIWDKFKNLSK